MEENPMAGVNLDDDEMDIEYDEDGNAIIPDYKKVINCFRRKTWKSDLKNSCCLCNGAVFKISFEATHAWGGEKPHCQFMCNLRFCVYNGHTLPKLVFFGSKFLHAHYPCCISVSQISVFRSLCLCVHYIFHMWKGCTLPKLPFFVMCFHFTHKNIMCAQAKIQKTPNSKVN